MNKDGSGYWGLKIFYRDFTYYYQVSIRRELLKTIINAVLLFYHTGIIELCYKEYRVYSCNLKLFKERIESAKNFRKYYWNINSPDLFPWGNERVTVEVLSGYIYGSILMKKVIKDKGGE